MVDGADQGLIVLESGHEVAALVRPGSLSGGFDFQTDPVKVETAVDNAKGNFKRDEEGKPELFSTEVYDLAQEIIPFVQQHLGRLKGKMM